ncbi:uncharacterized protein LOC133180643 [Saccostrea echinata]|uniref:uncharacterized protein LOC133180643 n=1 Tax=Saccostrea echinata TaxID=191078 RepID=UPI002A83F57F|nr:uncharacterized protein LOC133180643 [Saccostrea echinata]
MDILNQLKEYGESLGLKDEELTTFIREQQAIQRDERNAERELEKKRLDCEAEKEKVSLELEKERYWYEIEQMKVEKVYESQVVNTSKDVQSDHSQGRVTPKAPKLPVFNEEHDEMDSFLLRFERYAEAQKWGEENWAVNLSALLRGKALDVYSLMPKSEALDYKNLKKALLRRFELTDDGFKKKFRSCRPDQLETFAQFSVRLSSYFDRWIEMAKAPKTFQGLYDLMLRDQFLHICSQELRLFLKERIPDSLKKMADLADQYKDARNLSSVQAVDKGKGLLQKKQETVKKTYSAKNRDNVHMKTTNTGKFVPKSDRRCFKCHRVGHIASECKAKPVVGNVSEVRTEGESPTAQINEKPVCFVSTLPSDSIIDSMVNMSPTTLTSACQKSVNFSMPISAGYINGNPVTVLRDTGCSGIVVRKSKVSEKDLVDSKQQVCVLADGSKITVPVAEVFIDTPYLCGYHKVWCMENPVYDLIIGNVPDARLPDKADENWQVNAVETRQQKRNREKPYPPLKVPNIITDVIEPHCIKTAQEEDPTLTKIRDYAEHNTVHQKKNGKVKWYKKNGLLYREFVANDDSVNKVFSQLVVPEKFRALVMKLAHDSLLAGHLGIQRTITRVNSEFFWPGLQSDIRRFCQSCDICQRTLQKGRVRKVPLERMPLIDVPFQRVALDIVGPLTPVTEKGNRYILTLVDYSSRYPEAVALPSIETERVAEA